MSIALPSLVLAGVFCVGCATEERGAQNVPQPAAVAPASPQRGGAAADFLVVDCLLPGQVRKVGRQLTFLSARRGIKTTTHDCEILGGEYVAYDRANYATALKVWLPLANEGDPAAQTYVGEIYEKGLGVSPDYVAAADWYRRAAERGYARAAVNLGNLLEQGLGGPRDPKQALQWYRRAAGLNEVSFEASPAKNSDETQQLRIQIGDLRRELQGKQTALEEAQAELQRLRRSLEDRRSEAEAERSAVARLRQEFNDARASTDRARARVSELERSITDSEARAAAKDRQIADLRARQSAAESDAAAISAARAAAEAERTAAARMRRELDDVRGKSASALARVETLQRSMTDAEARLAAKDREIATLRASIDRTDAESRAERARLDREVATLRASLTRAEAEAGAHRAGLERLMQQAAAAGPKIELVQVQLIEPGVLTRDIRVRESGPAVTAPTVALVGRITSDVGIKAFTVNEQPQPLDKENVFRTQIPVPDSSNEAKRRIRLVAVDQRARSSTLDFLMPVIYTAQRDKGTLVQRSPTDRQREPAGAPRPQLTLGNYHALVIGNNNYQRMPTLRTAVNDATAVATVLKEQYRFRVTLLTNATRYQILSALNALRHELTSKDNLLVYYAGHGVLDEKNQRGYWLPVDAEPDNPANWVANGDVTAVLNIMEVKQLLLVVDSCYSGTLTRSATAQLEPGMTQEELLDVIRKLAQQRSRMVMTSGGVEPVLDSAPGSRHSAFAQVFLQILGENDGPLLGRELFRRLQLRVAAMAERMTVPQVPEYAPVRYAGHEAGDFVFVRAGS